MDGTFYLLVDTFGKVYGEDGASSYKEVAERFGLDPAVCQQYRFNLPLRRVVFDRGAPDGVRTALRYLNEHLGTPERLMQAARDGRFSKGVLMELLAPSVREAFAEACSQLERRFTEACTASGEPCLASGCAAEGEVCLEPLMRAKPEYQRACGAAWVRLFDAPEHRVPAWKR